MANKRKSKKIKKDLRKNEGGSSFKATPSRTRNNRTASRNHLPDNINIEYDEQCISKNKEPRNVKHVMIRSVINQIENKVKSSQLRRSNRLSSNGNKNEIFTKGITINLLICK